jgi:nitrogen fixation protein NifU and related proteins
MSDELYQKAILEHARRPAALPEGADRRASVDNPFCGDAVTVAARLEGGRIADVGYEADGCAIAKASASMMVSAVRGLDAAEVAALFARLTALLDGEALSLGELDALSGVARFPVRRRCATLPWEALRDAIR